jgi:NADH-quinone oxidoreductase subunit H
VIGLTLVVVFYLGGISNPIWFIVKSAGLLLVVAALQSMFARLKIDQTVGLWWRLGALMALLQLVAIILGRYLGALIR